MSDLICSQCGQKIEEKTTFCPTCGERVMYWYESEEEQTDKHIVKPLSNDKKRDVYRYIFISACFLVVLVVAIILWLPRNANKEDRASLNQAGISIAGVREEYYLRAMELLEECVDEELWNTGLTAGTTAYLQRSEAICAEFLVFEQQAEGQVEETLAEAFYQVGFFCLSCGYEDAVVEESGRNDSQKDESLMRRKNKAQDFLTRIETAISIEEFQAITLEVQQYQDEVS